MHSPFTSALPVTLLSLILLSPLPMVGAISSDRSICVRENAAMLAEAAACGGGDALRRCLRAAPGFVTLDDLRRCFIDVDCTLAEATSEAVMILESCDAGRRSGSNGSGSAPELRRRGPEAIPVATPPPKLRNDKRQPQAESTSAAAAAAATTTAALASRPSECSTASEVHTTVCPVSSIGEGQFTKLACASTVLTTSVCAATNVCFEDGGCIFRDDSVPASGVVVGAVLGVVVVAATGVLLYFYVRERRARRRAREAAEEEKRRVDEDAARRRAAQAQFRRERTLRQQSEAREWAGRAAPQGSQRRENPFADRAVSS